MSAVIAELHRLPPMQPPALIRCEYVGGQCTTWAHKFRPDHQPATAANGVAK